MLEKKYKDASLDAPNGQWSVVAGNKITLLTS